MAFWVNSDRCLATGCELFINPSIKFLQFGAKIERKVKRESFFFKVKKRPEMKFLCLDRAENKVSLTSIFPMFPRLNIITVRIARIEVIKKGKTKSTAPLERATAWPSAIY